MLLFDCGTPLLKPASITGWPLVLRILADARGLASPYSEGNICYSECGGVNYRER